MREPNVTDAENILLVTLEDGVRIMYDKTVREVWRSVDRGACMAPRWELIYRPAKRMGR